MDNNQINETVDEVVTNVSDAVEEIKTEDITVTPVADTVEQAKEVVEAVEQETEVVEAVEQETEVVEPVENSTAEKKSAGPILSLLSMIFGLVGVGFEVVLCCFTLIRPLGTLFGAAGIVLGIIGLNNNGDKNRAKVGIITGIVTIVLEILLWVLYLVGFGGYLGLGILSSLFSNY